MTEHKESSVLARFASPLLILATIIWGSSFVVMKSSVDVLPTFWLLAIRFSLRPWCWRWCSSGGGRCWISST